MDELDDYESDLFEPSEDDIAAISELLDNPRLAHIWHTLYIEGSIEVENNDENPFLWDGLTASELQEYVDIPVSTLNEDLDELVDIGAVDIASESQPKGNKSNFLDADGEHINEFDDERSIANPPLIGLVGQAYLDDSVAETLDEHGYDTLWMALLMYRTVLKDRTEYDFTELMLDLSEEQAESLLPSIQYIVKQMSRNPMWGEDYTDELEEDC